jgi:glycerol kinase
LQAKVVRPKVTETTALGAAYLAGLASGFWSGITEIRQQWQVDRAFSPSRKKSEIEPLVNGWHRAVKAAKAWSEDNY